MVDQKRNKDEKAGQQTGARGFDKKGESRDRDAAAAAPAKKTPTAINNDDDESTPASKQSSARQIQKPAGGQEGMRPKGKHVEEEDEGPRGAKSRNTPNSNR